MLNHVQSELVTGGHRASSTMLCEATAQRAGSGDAVRALSAHQLPHLPSLA
jgi:hypothetical protein